MATPNIIIDFIAFERYLQEERGTTTNEVSLELFKLHEKRIEREENATLMAGSLNMMKEGMGLGDQSGK